MLQWVVSTVVWDEPKVETCTIYSNDREYSANVPIHTIMHSHRGHSPPNLCVYIAIFWLDAANFIPNLNLFFNWFEQKKYIFICQTVFVPNIQWLIVIVMVCCIRPQKYIVQLNMAFYVTLRAFINAQNCLQECAECTVFVVVVVFN